MSADPGGRRRYSRHLLIPEVGVVGQRRLAQARVLVVGVGGLGVPVATYLAAAGVGRLGLLDPDVVDLTNLQRQVLYATADLGRPKVDVAAERLRALNPEIAIDAFARRLDGHNALDVVAPYDVIVDATDSFAARYLINDAARLAGKVDVYASIFRFEGQVSVFAPGGPCYRCLFPEPPPEGSVPTCAEGGVLGALAGLVGTWQATEVLKSILGIGTPLVGRLLLIDTLEARVREIAISADPGCVLHGPNAHLTRPGIDVSTPEGDAATIASLAAGELDAYLAERPGTLVLDARERLEDGSDVLPRSLPIPASELESRLHELDSAREYVVACRLGVRSRWAYERLRDAGFRRLRHLEGGALRYWAERDALFDRDGLREA